MGGVRVVQDWHKKKQRDNGRNQRCFEHDQDVCLFFRGEEISPCSAARFFRMGVTAVV